MDMREFDQLVVRITGMVTRRETVLGAAGGALATLGLAASADAGKKPRGRKAKKGKASGKRRAAREGKGRAVASERRRQKTSKACLCMSYEMLECKTRKVKRRSLQRVLDENPGSYSGACEPFSKWVPGRDR